MQVKGKTFVVTGSGSGMGRELTLLLLRKGAKVAAVDINEAALHETQALAGENAERMSEHVVNIGEREAVMALPKAVVKAHCCVDGVINNAGIIQKFLRISELECGDIERVVKINFWGTVYMTRAFLPYLMRRPEGHIVNISSMGGFLPVPGQTAYGASKAAVKLFTEGLHSELLDTNVHVTLVFPGAIATNISANSGVTMVGSNRTAETSKIKMTLPSRAAEIMVDGIEKNKYHVLVGSDAKTMFLLTRLMPEWAAKLIYSQMRELLPNRPPLQDVAAGPDCGGC